MFGIFGQTGSGKSTVLDAIVLSLYGDVWRSKSKSDFINLKTKKARVLFSFSCIERGKQKLYEVERTFNITKSGETLQKAQVFEILSNGKSQVVEGVNKVDLFLSKLIGLTENEFAKCIALPQGEFAGFLKAKPNERISIIGGIFDLNKYGEEIAEKVRRRVSERKNELTAIQSQMEIYGSVKQEDVDGLRQAYEKLKCDIAESEKILADYEKTIREEEDLAVLQTEFDKINGILHNVLSEGITIADKKLQISRAKKINDSITLIDTVEDLKRSMAEDEIKIKELQEVVNGERLNLGGVVEENKHRVEVLEETVKILLNKHILYENAKNDTKRLNDLKKTQIELVDKSEKLEIEKAKLSQDKYEKEMSLEAFNVEYEQKKEELERAKSELSRYDDVASYRLLERQKKFIDTHIRFLDIKIDKALNLKTKASEKINETIEKEDRAKTELFSLRLQTAHGREESKIDESTIRDELYKKMTLLGKLNVTEEYIANLNSRIESLKEDNARRRQAINDLEAEKAKKYQTYVSHLDELNKSKLNLESVTKSRLEIANKNAVAEFTEKYKVGDSCPVCSAEIMSKNVIAKLSTVVVEQQLADSKQQLDNFNQRRVDELYLIAKHEQQIQDHKSEIAINDKDIAKLDKEIISKCSKLLNKKGAKISDVNIVQLQLKNEIAEINKSLTKEAKLQEKLNQLLVDKIKYNTAFVSAGDKCTDYSELLDSLTENKLSLENRMSEIVFESSIEERESERKKILNRKADIEKKIESLHASIVDVQDSLRALTERHTKLQLDGEGLLKQLKETNEEIGTLVENLSDFANVSNFDDELFAIKSQIEASRTEIENCNEVSFKFANKIAESENKLFSMRQINQEHKLIYETTMTKLMENFAQVELFSLDGIHLYKMEEAKIAEVERFISNYDSNLAIYTDRKNELEAKINGRIVNPEILNEVKAKSGELENAINKKREEFGRVFELINAKQQSLDSYQKLEKTYTELNKKLEFEVELAELLRGKALLEYVAEEFIDDITYMASEKLQELMDGHYVLKYKNKDFYVVDNFNEGSERNVNTLSGGEVFVVSLALALSISDAIMSRSDKRIDFFFLDEGFGTLDKEYCEYIVSSLTKLSNSTMTIGLISHMPELQDKIKKKFLIQKATERSGSKVRYTETY